MASVRYFNGPAFEHMYFFPKHSKCYNQKGVDIVNGQSPIPFRMVIIKVSMWEGKYLKAIFS